MKNQNRIYTMIAVILVYACVSGCSMGKVLGDSPPTVSIRITSTADINPDINGRASPIVLRVYALKSDDVFNNADFFSLYDDDSNILGKDMTAREEFELSPGDSINFEKEFSLDTAYVGVMAAYRDLDNAVWRGSVQTPINKTTYIDVNLGRLTLTVKPGDK